MGKGLLYNFDLETYQNGMVENENRLKTVFVLVAVEVLCIKCPRTAFAVVVVKCIILHFLKERVYRQQ